MALSSFASHWPKMTYVKSLTCVKWSRLRHHHRQGGLRDAIFSSWTVSAAVQIPEASVSSGRRSAVLQHPLGADSITGTHRDRVSFFDRIYSPLVTLWVFLGQVLSQDHSCRAAVARLAERCGRDY